MLRPYKPFVARQCDIEGSDRRRGSHRGTVESQARTVAPPRRRRASRTRVHRVRSWNRRAATLRTRRRGCRACWATACVAPCRARSPDARETRQSLSRHRGAAMVAPARAPLRTDRLRAVNEPRTVTVELHESGLMKVGRLGGRSVGNVEAILESWRIDDEWWRQPISRSYLELLLEGGKRVVVFQDLMTGLWF